MTNIPQRPLVVENWPCAYPDTGASALFKSVPEDFQVEELLSEVLDGEGEHLWLWVEKRGANTVWVAAQLAKLAGVKEQDVGFAGIKDRHAVTKQWFSVYLPTQETPDLTLVENEEFTVLKQQRHRRKLRRGELDGNRFTIRLRDVCGDRELLESNLAQLKAHGYPNYFGEQRFGHDGGNLEAGMAMLTGKKRVRQRSKKSIYLSAVRSWVFNQVLAERVRQSNWLTALAGDPEAFPTGPLWGRGRTLSSAETGVLEQEITQTCQAVCDALEHAGLSQERRALAVTAQDLQWQWLEGDAHDLNLQLSFSLGAGYYATSLLRELLSVQEPERKFPGDA
ncbi:MAG: tRNA pseudouridine(13) synthase TruD [Oceanobacter sp.]